jgi:hypothetical protein
MENFARDSNSSMLNTAVLFIVFNRPETTKRVWEAIECARPSRLYIAADGPRTPEEDTRCQETRKITESIHWNCEVKRLYQDQNLGCGRGPSTAISWFFEHEEEGIILEDDCLPAASFFPFCTELLARYRHDARIMQIGGNNMEEVDDRDTAYSYRFSSLIYIWGWATWRRAWKLHDFHMHHYTEVNKKGYLVPSYKSIFERDLYQYVFGKMFKGDHVTSSQTIWDYQWQFACKINSGLIIVPNRNLVVNLGFGENASNTHDPTAIGYDLKMESMYFPLKHPEFLMVDQTREDRVFRKVCTSRISRLKSVVKNAIPKPLFDALVRPLITVFS